MGARAYWRKITEEMTTDFLPYLMRLLPLGLLQPVYMGDVCGSFPGRAIRSWEAHYVHTRTARAPPPWRSRGGRGIHGARARRASLAHSGARASGRVEPRACAPVTCGYESGNVVGQHVLASLLLSLGGPLITANECSDWRGRRPKFEPLDLPLSAYLLSGNYKHQPLCV